MYVGLHRGAVQIDDLAEILLDWKCGKVPMLVWVYIMSRVSLNSDFAARKKKKQGINAVVLSGVYRAPELYSVIISRHMHCSNHFSLIVNNNINQGGPGYTSC